MRVATSLQVDASTLGCVDMSTWTIVFERKELKKVVFRVVFTKLARYLVAGKLRSGLSSSVEDVYITRIRLTDFSSCLGYLK